MVNPPAAGGAGTSASSDAVPGGAGGVLTGPAGDPGIGGYMDGGPDVGAPGCANSDGGAELADWFPYPPG